MKSKIKEVIYEDTIEQLKAIYHPPGTGSGGRPTYTCLPPEEIYKKINEIIERLNKQLREE